MYEKRKAYFNSTFVNGEKKTLATGSGRGGGGGRGRAPAGPPEFPPWPTRRRHTRSGWGWASSTATPATVKYGKKNLASVAVERQNQDDDGAMRPQYSLMTGFIGTSWISKALSDNGLDELAYRVLENNQYPSWLYAVDQGATSIWERLNGYTVENGFGGNNSMNSFNHYSFGAVGQWMMAYSLGIQRDEPGFRKFILQPTPDPTGVIKSAEGYYDSMYGRIISAWKIEGKTLSYRTTVPANTIATLYLPAASADAIREAGKDARQSKGVTFLKYENGKAVYTLASGTYDFTANR